MDWYDTVFEVIDMRSFSNLWYWIALAVLWSTISHWILGVPFDMVLRARREMDGEAMRDLEDLVRINTGRILHIAEVSGTWLLVFGSALLTALTLMAVLYGIEFAQAVLLLAAPVTLVGILSLRTCRVIRERRDSGLALIRRLMRHRLLTQIIGIVSIFVTAVFGMYKNLYVGPLPY